MRKLLVVILLLAIAGAIFGYLIYRRRPLPTPLGWKAHVTTIAGDGTPVLRDGKQSGFSDPFGVAVAKDGTIYVADAGESNRIRKIAPDGNVTTLAGGKEGRHVLFLLVFLRVGRIQAGGERVETFCVLISILSGNGRVDRHSNRRHTQDHCGIEE